MIMRRSISALVWIGTFSVCALSSSVVDETQFSNPLSFDYHFDDDLLKTADTNDIYDEVVPILPRYRLHKNGRDEGFTSVPIVTRRGGVWSTPPPPPRRANPNQQWTPPKHLPIPRVTVEPVFFPTKAHTQSPKAIRQKVESKFAQRLGGSSSGRQSGDSVARVFTTTASPPSRRTNPVRLQTLATAQPWWVTLTTTARPTTTTRTPWNRVASANAHPLSGSSSSALASRPNNAPMKPPIIQHGDSPYKGPTYNCRILNPFNDGHPSPRTDHTCLLSMPGFSADGNCRCTYEVESRDSNGCATGFLFTCSRR